MNTNRPNRNLLAGLLTCLALCFSLSGCGGPKYASKFKDWFSMNTIEKNPIKIIDVKIEETAAAGDSAVFQFTATGETTEDLYEQVDFADFKKLRELMEKFNLYIDYYDEAGKNAKDAIKESLKNMPVTLEIVTPKNHKISFKGKTRATLGNNGWIFNTIQLTQEELKGNPKPTQQANMIKGSAEHKKRLVTYQTAVDHMQIIVDKQKKITDEEYNQTSDKIDK